jgi:hypothetical protein
MKSKSLFRSIGLGILVACVALTAILAALPVTTARAAELNQGGLLLENLLKREQIVINDQQARLTLSQQAVGKAQQWIADLQAEGKDTTTLQTALSAFQTALTQAQTSLNTAKQALDAHAGFDASGQMIDATQAWKTLIDAGRAERQFHLTITQATIDVRAAVRAYLQANK